MANYAIMRMEKRKLAAVGRICKHNERLKKEYKSNPDIDPEKRELNYHIIRPNTTYRNAVLKRIEEAGTRRRKDSVVLQDCFIGATPDWIKAKTAKEQEAVQEQITSYNEARAEEQDKRSAAEKVADLFARYGEFDELAPGLLNTLIDKITVSEPYVIDGRFKQDVTIFYRYIGALEVVQHDATRFYKSEKCTQASQKRAARQMKERIAAVQEEAEKKQDELPPEKTA